MPYIIVAGNTTGTSESRFGYLDYIAASLFALGLIIEVSSDIQKANWVKSGRKGGFCTVGWWAFSRHPNYFGEMLMWWMAWLFSVSSILLSNKTATYIDSENTKQPYTVDRPSLFWGFFGIISPIFTQLVLLFVSGMPLAEGPALKRFYENPNLEIRENYINYRENTSILVPMPQFLWKVIPVGLKRSVLFCEFKRYEYVKSEYVDLAGESEKDEKRA